MNTMLKISACFLCGAGIGLLLCWHWEKDCECSADKENLSGGSTENLKKLANDSVSVGIEQPPQLEKQSIVPVTENQQGVESNSQRWATRQGVMEIAQGILPKEQREKIIFDKLATRRGVMEVATKELPLRETVQSIVKRWGTRQGVIDLAIEKENDTRKQAQIMYRQRKSGSQAATAFSDHLRKNFDVVQLSIRNISGSDRDITIGAGNTVSPPLPGDVEDHQLVANASTGVHPQGIIVNPFNGLIYVANQLSGTVTVAAQGGVIQQTISLQSALFPGISSPVALSVNTIPGSPHYGKVYVVNSVADTVSIIDTNFEVTKHIPAGSRPVAIAFNPKNEMLYVANLASGNVTVIETVTEQVVATLGVGRYTRAIGINSENGDIYIVNSGDNSITVYDLSHQLLVTINNAGIHPGSIAWHPDLHKMYVVAQANGQVIPVNADDYSPEAALAIGLKPHGIVFNPANRLLYISDKENHILQVVDGRTNAVTILPAPGINIGLAVHPNQNIVFWTNTAFNEVQVMGFTAQSSFIQVDTNELAQLLSYFRHNPGLLEHLKIVVTGEKTLGQLQVVEKTISGKKQERSVSLSNYRSPQHFQNVYEVEALKGLTLDGNTKWGFALPGNHAATMLVYYKSLEKGELLNTLIKNHKNNLICQN